jgi:adenylate kinase family enzyme
VERVAFIGNAGGGKSVLARRLAAHTQLPYVELDCFIVRPDGQMFPDEVFDREHERLIAEPRWIIDGICPMRAIAPRLERASHIVLIDLPLWLHYAIASDRQKVWADGKLQNPPGGQLKPSPTATLFQLMWDIDQNWMPHIRALCAQEEAAGKIVTRLTSANALQAFGKNPRKHAPEAI